jgi:hypothetical protein
LASYKGRRTPLGEIFTRQIVRRVLEIVLPRGQLKKEQLDILWRAQEEARKKGVEIIYYQAQ